MSKSKTSAYGLKFGHPTEFRRTVTIGEGKSAQRVVLTFQPNAPLDLSEQEIKGLAKEIDSGMLVPWEEDEKGRQLRGNARPSEAASSRLVIADEGTEESDSTDDETEDDVEESPVASVNATDAKDAIGRMHSVEKLQSIVDTDGRSTVIEAAQRRLEEIGG